jgi:hypothetical protein
MFQMQTLPALACEPIRDDAPARAADPDGVRRERNMRALDRLIGIGMQLA